MNNKYLKYFLIVAVVGIWVTIIYRIAIGLGGTVSPIRAIITPPIRDLNIASDTFSLYADYPDPFLPESDSTAINMHSKAESSLQTGRPAAIDSSSTKEFVAHMIQFNGIISNPQKKSLVGLITLQGNEYLVKEREKIGNIQIKHIGKDKILILYNGQLYAIGKL